MLCMAALLCAAVLVVLNIYSFPECTDEGGGIKEKTDVS